MRWLRYLLFVVAGLLGIAFIVLLFLGGFRGQARHVVSVDIEAPAPVVFAWVSEPGRLRAAANVSSQRSDNPITITRADRDRLIEAQIAVPEDVTADVRYELEPMGPLRTRLTFRATYRYPQWRARLFEPIISRSVQRALERDVARLKEQIEQRAQGPAR